MKVIFKNPITGKFEVGLIFKKHFTNGTEKFDVISEKSSIFVALSKDRKKSGYIDEILTEKIIYSIETNLSRETQGNYADSYIPKILKFSV